MRRKTTWLLVLVALAALGLGCATPGAEMNQRLDRLPQDVRQVVRDAVWAHGNPYNWTALQSAVVQVQWWDYRHGARPLINRKVYCLDLKAGRMRIDDLTDRTVALYDGATWRVFARGQEMRLPATITEQTVGYLALFEYAAGEMRSFRTMFSLPFSLLADGVELKSAGPVQAAGGANQWNVLEVRFDPNATGFLRTDRLLVYFDPVRKAVDRVFVELSDAPFYAIPHWGEWSDYRRLQNGLVLAHRWDFRMTDEKGGADLGRRLSVVLDKVAFNQPFAWNLFTSAEARPPAIPDGPAEPKVKTLGRDVVGAK